MLIKFPGSDGGLIVLRRILVVSWLASRGLCASLSADTSQCVLPSKSGADEDAGVLVSVASASAVPRATWTAQDSAQIEGALGRTHWLAAHPSGVTTSRPGAATFRATAQPSGFDVWAAVSALNALPGSGVRYEFAVAADRESDAFFAIGCDDCAELTGAGRILLRTEGRREFMRAENLVEVHLRPGINRFTITSYKVQAWSQVPVFHDGDEWRISIDVFATASGAWKFCRSINWHFLDTAVADTPEDVRMDSFLFPGDDVQLLNLSGARVGSGKIDQTGRIKWQTETVVYPFLGFVSYRGFKDAILLCGEYAAREALARCIETRPSFPVSPWILRGRVLFDSLNTGVNPDCWWTRKVTLDLIMGQLGEAKVPASVLGGYTASRLKFGTFVSHLDSTHQYYRICDGATPGQVGVVTLVILPAVGSKVRPYLKSAAVADLKGAEIEGSVALAEKVRIVWPGLVDADCGGNFARTELDEQLGAIARAVQDPHPRWYLVGTCSSGVTALGYAESRNVNGIILRTPAIQRPLQHWFRGLDYDDVALPSPCIAAEGDDNVAALRGTRIYIIFDHDVPGHGDPTRTRELCSRLTELGVQLEQHWPVPEKGMIWGERERQELLPIVYWAKADRGPALFGAKPEPVHALNVKDALLEGFSIDSASQLEPLESWLRSWRQRWATFRGEEWKANDFGTAPTTIATEIGNQSQLLQCLYASYCGGDPLIARPAALSDKTPLWGYRIEHPADGKNIIKIFGTSNIGSTLPKMDLIMDGSCKAAVWAMRGGIWRLEQVWL